MFPSQTNTRPLGGSTPYLSGVSLVGLEGRLVKLTDGGAEAALNLPGAIADLCIYIVVDGLGAGEQSEVIPIVTGKESRARANGAGSAGAILVLEDPVANAGVNAGKIRTLPAAEGVYFSPGSAAEDFVDEQLVKFIGLPRLVFVGSAFTGAAPAATAATNAATPYGYSTQVQADAIVANVRELRAWAIANGFKATNA